MYLKRVEMQGFKSFPDKIRLDFDKGITGVVGPNGSGKSNIGDAVRWVLGEKSAKNLRGAKMEDVIFNGTANRKPLGIAEVSLVMDNTDRKLNLDYSEITVTRRMYRTGESDYLINGTKCRAKDITELFLDTGVGKEGYSIIGQGRIDEILSTKSEDRRSIFEEAAGIAKYRARCNEAQSKLEKERENLERVNEVLYELEQKVEPLRIQSEKAKKARKLTEELKTVEVSKFVTLAEKYEEDKKELEENITELGHEIQTEEKKESAARQKAENNKRDTLDIEKNIENYNTLIIDKNREKEEARSEIKLTEGEIKHLGEKRASEEEGIDKNKTDIEKKDGEIKETEASVSALLLETENLNRLFKSESEEYERLNEYIQQAREKLENYNSTLLEKMNEVSAVNARLEKNATMTQQLGERENQAQNNFNVLDGKKRQLEVSKAATEKKLENINADINNIWNSLSHCAEEKTRLRTEKEEKSKKLNEAISLSHSINSRYNALSELKKSYSGFYEGVKAVLSQRDMPELKGIHGAVGELLETDEKYETAIDVALGSAVQNIVADNEGTVKNAINLLKRQGKGRATFLPMTAIKGRESVEVSGNGVIGSAKSLIRYDAKYENIFSNLLERVIIVDTMDNAVALSKATAYKYKIVTLTGEVFNAGGSITGGSTSKKSSGIFSRNRELSELEEKIRTNEQNKKELTLEYNNADKALNEISEKMKKYEDERHALEIKKTETELEIKNILSSYEDVEARQKSAEEEIDRLEELTRQNDLQLKADRDLLASLNKELEGNKTEIDAFKEKMQSESLDIEKKNQKITDLRFEIAEKENAAKVKKSDIERLKSEQEALEKDILVRQKEIVAINASIEELKQKNEEALSNIEKIEAEHEKLLKELADINEYKKVLKEKLSAIEEDIRACFERKSAAEKKISSLEAKKENIEQKSSDLYNRMWDEYEITYASAREYERLELSDYELSAKERELKSQIRSLGNINYDSIEEYRSVSEKYEFLKTNKADIEEAEEKLKQIITHLTQLMEVQFKEQLSVINENFKIVFKEMFMGGNALIELSDENDVLGSGIDISAQPPGKALQSMTLLSGGERALTAISLLFAILKMRPSPFCILDEIDAPLDPANVSLYAHYLENFTQDTQFIIVTHRKGTMECADTLYGVTMQEQGVSTLVSVNFEENT